MITHEPVPLHQQRVCYDDTYYAITDLIDAAKELPVIEVPTVALSLHYRAPCSDTLLSFAKEMLRVQAADLSFPIIMSDENRILDGRHRLIKAMITNTEYIKIVRLLDLPHGTPVEDDK